MMVGLVEQPPRDAIGSGTARGVLIVILVVEEDLVLSPFPIALAEMLGKLPRHGGEPVLVVTRKAFVDRAGCQRVPRNELLILHDGLGMLRNVPLVGLAQIAGPILEQREVDDRHRNRGARQIGEGRARKQGTIVRVPVLPAYYLGVCAFARQ